MMENGSPRRFPIVMAMALLGSLPMSDSLNRHTPMPKIMIPHTITISLRRQDGDSKLNIVLPSFKRCIEYMRKMKNSDRHVPFWAEIFVVKSPASYVYSTYGKMSRGCLETAGIIVLEICKHYREKENSKNYG